MLVAAGGALAIAQPGDLGDDEESAAVQETTTTTTLEVATTEATTTTVPDTTTTTVGGSGIGGGGTPNGGVDGVADTGAEAMLGPGLALGALGLALRRAAKRPAS